MAALDRVNSADLAYDGDAASRSMDAAFSELFDTDVIALWVTTGTAANGLALAALCPPHGAVICHRDAHIQNDECGAPEFYTHGAKLLLVDGPGGKITPDALNACLGAVPNGVHWAQPHAISITNATEYGLVYTPNEVAALGAIARERGLGFHMDGARFANAMAFLDCTPADLTWKAGIDILSFGFIKNGGMSAEALVFFRPDLAEASRYRRKRAGHLLSKGRYSAAQILAMLKDDIWLKHARAANEGARRLARSVGSRLVQPVEANEVFVKLSAQEAASLRARGYGFYDWSKGQARFVISYDKPDHEIEALSAAFSELK